MTLNTTAGMVAFHDDPPCDTALDDSGRCPKCDFIPDKQSVGLRRSALEMWQRSTALGLNPFEGVPDTFFHTNRNEGQLWLDDRRVLWSIVRTLQPAVCAETGTWRGGGSTFFIASALWHNGGGHLYTVEDNREMVEIAVKNYDTKWPHLEPHLKMFHGDSIEVYGRVLRGKRLDFVFIDGGENPIAEREFELLGPMVRKGGILANHDEFNGKHIKALENHPDWRVIEIVGNGSGSFDRGSVGLMIAEKLA